MRRRRRSRRRLEQEARVADLQEDCNAIGQAVRDLEEMAQALGDEEIVAAATNLHEALANGFRDHIRPQHPELDWNAIAGNGAARAGSTAESGTKHEPK
jgi:hypothetical protein